MTKQTKGFALRMLGLTASLIALWHLDEWSEFDLLVSSISPFVFLFVMVLAMVSTWFTSLRWRLLDPDVASQMRHRDYFRYVMIGATANMFMPGALGGDAVRMALVAKDLNSHRGVAIAAILVDRWVGLFSIVLLGTLACLAATGLQHRTQLLSVLLVIDGAFLVGWIVALNKPLSDALSRFANRPGALWKAFSSLFSAWRATIVFYAAHPARVVGALGLCMPIHASWFVIVYVLAREIGVDLSFGTLSMVTALSWLIAAAPISFGGVGVRELSFVYLLSLQGIDAERAAVLGAFQSAIFVVRALLGAPFFWLGRRKSVEAAVHRKSK